MSDRNCGLVKKEILNVESVGHEAEERSELGDCSKRCPKTMPHPVLQLTPILERVTQIWSGLEFLELGSNRKTVCHPRTKNERIRQWYPKRRSFRDSIWRSKAAIIKIHKPNTPVLSKSCKGKSQKSVVQKCEFYHHYEPFSHTTQVQTIQDLLTNKLTLLNRSNENFNKTLACIFVLL